MTDTAPPTRGCFSAVADDVIDGLPIRRLMFCYRTIGCAHYRSEAGGCTMCAFPAMSTGGVAVPVAALNAQLDAELAAHEWPGEALAEVDLFCAGSFLNDEEVPPASRRHAYEAIRRLPGVRKLLVESRPEFVTRDRIGQALDILGPAVRLEVAVGLESADDRIREDVIRKGFGRPDFEAAMAALAASGSAEALVYVFLKPPGLTELQSLDDAEATVRYVFRVARDLGLGAVTAAVQPAFVQGEGLLHDLYAQGAYRPPWIWTVIELILRVAAEGELQIGTNDDSPPPEAVRANCGLCDAACEAAIATFNRTLDPEPLRRLDCDCRGRWRRETGITPVAG